MAKLKSALSDKDKLLVKQKNIYKEIKLMKDQWRASETIRSDQAKQIRDLQIRLVTAEKENKKLRKHFSRATVVPEKDKKSTGKSTVFGQSPAESLTPIRVVVSKRASNHAANVVAQESLFA